MNDRIKKALADFETAQKEYRKAKQAYEKANKDYEDFVSGIRGNVSAWIDNKIEIQKKKDAAFVKADHVRKLTEVVMWAASQNVVDIAGNVFFEAVKTDPEKYNVPLHYKKFKKLFYEIIPEEYFYFSWSEYSFTICFSSGVYGKNDRWLFSVKNGLIALEDRDVTRKENDLETIRKEAKQAFKDSEKLKKAIETLAAADTRKNYNTAIQYYMPYFDKYAAVRDDYKMF